MKHILLTLLLIVAINVSANTGRYRLMFNTDPSTEITVGWEQVNSANPVVYYGTVDHGTNWASYANSQTPYRQVTYQGMDNRFAVLTGLTPNTIYYFVIKDDAGTSQRYWFKTCPNVNTETLSFISGGDSRSGATQRRNSNRMVAKIRPHAVLFGGDLQNTPSNAVMQEWLDDWQLTITSDNQMIPVVHSFGNHEDYGNGGPNLIRDLFDTNYDVYYNLRFGGDLFSMYTLNGEVLPGHTIANNTVRVAQRNWLNTTLQADNSIWKAAQYHRPIVPHYSSKGEGSDEFYDWANLFYEYGVRLVMESDAHVVKLTEEVRPNPSYTGLPHTSPGGSSSNWFTTAGIDPNKGITFVGEGTWGTIRTPDDTHPMTTATASIYGFNWILVDACKIEIRTIDTQNPAAVPEHTPGDYTSISPGLDGQIWKPGAMPSGLRSIIRCNPPIVDFTASATNVFTGANINFTDLTANSPTTWSWDFGDGVGTSSAQNPSYSYATAGTYTVTLTCTNAEGSDTETKVAYIVVSDPVAPTADFLADITSASVGQIITFSDLTTGVPTSWSWNFGDANTSTAQNPTHSYAAPGVYTVTLTSTNAYGNDTETKTAYITVNAGGAVAVTISQGTDDAEEFRVGGFAGDMYLTSSDLEIGNDGGDEQYVGLRFQNVTVPQGATISNAYIRFRADENDGIGSQLNIYIAAQDIDNAPTFTGANYNLSGRTFTSTQLTWADGTVPAWSNPNLYDTPDISAVIQEVVDRGGWVNGNAMAFFLWSDIGESSERVADSYEGGYPAELIFDYTIPSSLPVELSNFTGKNDGCINSLNWTTQSESNASHFNLERSYDGASWEFITQQQATGTTTEQTDYEYIDRTSSGSNIVYYRLIQYDLDGTAAVAGSIGLKYDCANAEPVVYPNPTKDMITIESSEFDMEMIVIYDANGRKMAEKTVKGMKTEMFLNQFRTGLYNVEIHGNGQVYHKRVVKQ
ncbi:MAG: PKD domain-containing protein [Fluviicola sp.]